MYTLLSAFILLFWNMKAHLTVSSELVCETTEMQKLKKQAEDKRKADKRNGGK